MKESLLNAVNTLREDGVDFNETPPIFRWFYEEEPDLVFELLIRGREVGEEKGKDEDFTVEFTEYESIH